MPLCFSFFSRGLDESVLRNHTYYSQLYGYQHIFVEANHIWHPAVRDSYKYSQILSHLYRLEEGDLLFFLDDDSVVFRPVALDRLMESRDLIVVSGPPSDGHPSKPLMNMMVVRNTAASRSLLHALVSSSCHVITMEIERVELESILAPVGLLPCGVVLADRQVNISWRHMNWYTAEVFVVCLGALPAAHADGRPFDQILHDLNLQKLLVRQVNGALFERRPVLQPPAYPVLSIQPQTSLNPSARIAFVMLYTHHIQSYACVAEHNITRYCRRHGYAYHVYREIPEELGSEISGSWTKPWVLQRHMADHDWIVWIDADMIFLNQAKRIESLLAGRDLLMAKDIGGWPVNSGLLGFRNTPRNVSLLAQICEKISKVTDRSSVYSSQGDQYYFNEVFRAENLLGENNIYDNVTINTPSHLFKSDTFLVHFINLGEPYRSVYMADVDTKSLR